MFRSRAWLIPSQRFLTGLTRGFDAIIMMAGILPANEIVRISGGSIESTRTNAAFEASIHSTLAPNIYTGGHV
jgi:hypothetical protein